MDDGKTLRPTAELSAAAIDAAIRRAHQARAEVAQALCVAACRGIAALRATVATHAARALHALRSPPAGAAGDARSPS